MERSDIRAGVIYALRESNSVIPVVFLEDQAATLWRERHSPQHLTITRSPAPDQGAKPGKAHIDVFGYPAITATSSSKKDLRQLTRINLSVEIERLHADERAPSVPGTRWKFITSLDVIVPWEG